MEDLLLELKNSPSSCLVIMPITRLVYESKFEVGKFNFYPPEEIDFQHLNLVDNLSLDEIHEINIFEGIDLREACTSLTGFDLNILKESFLVTFIEEVDWNSSENRNHNEDITILKSLSNKVERALDVVRLDYCRLDLPDTLPGMAGAWSGSQDYLGALIYSGLNSRGRLIAGSAVECSVVIKGLGLQIDGSPCISIPSANDGELGGIVSHALSLFSDSMRSPSQTTKFMRVMTLLEFLASPDEYKSWKKIKGDLACHCVTNKDNYLKILERFKNLTSVELDGVQKGLRTLIVHNGMYIEDLLSVSDDRISLFRELQGYVGKILDDMIKNSSMSWPQFVEHREELKLNLGVKSA